MVFRPKQAKNQLVFRPKQAKNQFKTRLTALLFALRRHTVQQVGLDVGAAVAIGATLCELYL